MLQNRPRPFLLGMEEIFFNIFLNFFINFFLQYPRIKLASLISTQSSQQPNLENSGGLKHLLLTKKIIPPPPHKIEKLFIFGPL